MKVSYRNELLQLIESFVTKIETKDIDHFCFMNDTKDFDYSFSAGSRRPLRRNNKKCSFKIKSGKSMKINCTVLKLFLIFKEIFYQTDDSTRMPLMRFICHNYSFHINTLIDIIKVIETAFIQKYFGQFSIDQTRTVGEIMNL